jgi:hypothetical protein
MSNVKVQSSNQIQSSNFKHLGLDICHLFGIWILTFELLIQERPIGVMNGFNS